jgi:hypothetical protein
LIRKPEDKRSNEVFKLFDEFINER